MSEQHAETISRIIEHYGLNSRAARLRSEKVAFYPVIRITMELRRVILRRVVQEPR
jgi:hypothetical protein